MKITIEANGYRMVIDEEQLANVHLSLPSELAEVPCDCAKGPCGYVHRVHAGAWRIELEADLKSQPLWKDVR